MAKISPRGNYHTLVWSENGKQRRISLGKIGTIPQKDLEAILVAKQYELSYAAKLLHHGRRPAPRFGQYVADYMVWHQGEYPDSHCRVAQIIDQHLVPHFGTTALNLITTEQGEAYKAKRRFRVAANSLVKEWRVMMAILNRAVRTKVITENPLGAVKPPKVLDSKPHHYYGVDQLQMLYEASAYGTAWKFMANTGLRRGEALIIRREWITDAIRIRSTGEERTKDGEWRKIPLTDGAREALKDLPKSGLLIPKIAPESLSRAFARDVRRCGLEGSLHSLRHSYICHLLLAGVPIRTVQLYAGHSHIATTEKYAYQVLRQDPEAALRMAI